MADAKHIHGSDWRWAAVATRVRPTIMVIEPGPPAEKRPDAPPKRTFGFARVLDREEA